LPAAIEQIILRALDKEPQNRFTTARGMVQALQRAWARELLEKSGPASKEDPGQTTNQPAPGPNLDRGTEDAESLRVQPGEPSRVELTEEQAKMVLWIIEHNKGRLSRAKICQRMDISERAARQLVKEWIEAGLAIKSSKKRRPPTVSSQLATLARKRLREGS
jgi:hypothetical protein